MIRRGDHFIKRIIEIMTLGWGLLKRGKKSLKKSLFMLLGGKEKDHLRSIDGPSFSPSSPPGSFPYRLGPISLQRRLSLLATSIMSIYVIVNTN